MSINVDVPLVDALHAASCHDQAGPFWSLLLEAAQELDRLNALLAEIRNERREVFTPDELGAKWKCSPDVVRKLIRDGRLYGFNVGTKCWRISSTAVQAFEMGQA
jgi:hypothetical protein